jgi:hypothetical protein
MEFFYGKKKKRKKEEYEEEYDGAGVERNKLDKGRDCGRKRIRRRIWETRRERLGRGRRRKRETRDRTKGRPEEENRRFMKMIKHGRRKRNGRRN